MTSGTRGNDVDEEPVSRSSHSTNVAVGVHPSGRHEILDETAQDDVTARSMRPNTTVPPVRRAAASST
jgi:hypothetical protein